MFFDAVFAYQKTIFATLVAVVVVASLGLGKLEISTDNRIFYGPDNPYFQDYLNFESEFTVNDSILFVITAPYLVTERDYPDAIRWLTEHAGSLSDSIRVDSLANYPHPHTDGATLVVEPLLDEVCPRDQPCDPALGSLLSKPYLINRLVSDNQTSTGVLATVSVERGAVGEIESLQQEVELLADSFREKYPHLEINFTGGVPMMAAFAQATADDLSVLLPTALIVISIALALVLGSRRLAGIVVAMGLASIVTTLGFAGWANHTLNNATSIVPLIVFTLVVTSSMHIVVHFARNLSRREPVAQARASLSASFVPIVISAVTSAVSLCSLWYVDSPPLRELGILSAVGVLIGFVFTVTALPLLLCRVRSVRRTPLGKGIQAAVNLIARKQETGKGHAAAFFALLALCSSGLLLLEVNDDFVQFFDESVPFRAQTDRATEVLAGPNHLEVVVRNDQGSVFEPGFLSYTDRMTKMLRTEPLVANAHAFSDVMQQVATAFGGGRLDGQTADEIAQLFLVYELSLQLGQTNTDLINAAQDSGRISVLLKEATSSEIQGLERRIDEWHRLERSPYSIVITGENIPVAHLSGMNIRSMATGIVLSLTFTAFLVGFAFKSVRLGVVALCAIALPVACGFGAWGWINSEIGLAATAVIALTIGVVVDDAAHYIYRFLDARNRLSMDPWSSVAYATHRAGAAIVCTSLVMGLGLALLMLSSFEVNSSFGAVACLIIAAAMIFVLFVLPHLIVWTTKRSGQLVESYQ